MNMDLRAKLIAALRQADAVASGAARLESSIAAGEIDQGALAEIANGAKALRTELLESVKLAPKSSES